jgi:hypothetical protein
MPNIVNPVLGSLSCANSSILPKAELTVPYLASFIATYTGGNGASYLAQDVTSTGVTGLTAHLDSGVLNNGAGNLVYVITGTATTTGTANFTITIGEKACSFGITVVEKGQGGTGCATDYSNCTYKTITLEAGDTYILPDGAEIIGATDTTVLQSDGCLDLTKISEVCCFNVFIANSDNSCDYTGIFSTSVCGETPIYDSVNIEGISLAGVDYPFSYGAEVDAFSPGNVNGVQGLFNTSAIGPLLQVISVGQAQEEDRGTQSQVSVNVPCDMGDNLFLYGTASSNGVGPDPVGSKIYFRFLPC